MHNNEMMPDILIAYLKGEITGAQEAILNSWLNESEENRRIFSLLNSDEFVWQELNVMQSFDDGKLSDILQRYSPAADITVKPKRKKWFPLTAAAAVVLMVIFLGFYLSDTHKKDIANTAKKVVKDIPAPVVAKAFIKTDNNKVILLDTIKSNAVFKLNGADVMKNDSGQIVYKSSSPENRMNTLFNPRGGNIVTVVLSDGTKVWLNSESSITYPIQFNDSARDVSVTGEAYFEVTKSKHQKFVVTTDDGITTEVLGTHFNIQSYEDEGSSVVTLLEGLVQVRNSREKLLLAPAQQVVQKAKDVSLSVRQANLSKIMAWKTGIFDFDEDDIYTIARQFSRWYDIKVKVNGDFSNETYTGVISRKLSLMQVMQVLKFAGLNYQLVNNQLVITKI